jgi:hypothetical protein
LEHILKLFGLEPDNYTYKPFGSGHINTTFSLDSISDSKQFVLQKININVFKEPQIIAKNIGNTSDYLAKNHQNIYLSTKLKPQAKKT